MAQGDVGEVINTAVVYISSDSYVKQTGTSIYSLLENNVHIKNLDIYVISTGISQRNKERLRSVAAGFQRKIEVIDGEGLIAEICNRGG